MKPSTATVISLSALRDELEKEIREIAASGADGATFECDIRHGQIAEIDSVIQLVLDRAQAAADAAEVEREEIAELRELKRDLAEVHAAARGKGDQGAWDVWNAVALALDDHGQADADADTDWDMQRGL